MNHKAVFRAIAAGRVFDAAQASAVTIDFEGLAVGTTVGAQYPGLGAIFVPNGFSGAGGPTGSWATNTDMTIVSSTGSDVGGLGSPPLVSGKIMRSFNGWLGENGDPSFSITFSTPVSSVSATLAGVFTAADTRLFAYDGASLLGVVAGSTAGQFTLGFAAPSITKVLITPGDFNDWVGVDNIAFQPVPEAGTCAMMALGLALLAFRRRRG